MRPRFGIGFGLLETWSTPVEFARAVSAIEGEQFDSLWLSDHVNSATPDPLTSLAYAAAITSRIRLGTSVLVLPGRPVAVTAKALATLSALSGDRLLCASGIGVPEELEHRAFGVERSGRGDAIERQLSDLRVLLSGRAIDDGGPLHGVSIGMSTARPIEQWLGGRVDQELRRVGRAADGWLGSFTTPAESRRAVELIAETAAAHDRRISDDHYGMLVLYSSTGLDDRALGVAAQHRPDTPVTDLCPTGADQITDLIGQYVDAGVSKFVLVPANRPLDWPAEMAWLRDVVAPIAAARPRVGGDW